MTPSILVVAIRYEQDVVIARQRARQIAALLGFEAQEQTRIATAVSEIARNAFRYAGGGRVTFGVEGRTAPQVLAIRVRDEGPGIPELSRVLEGEYRSQTGMGLGIVGARRLVDRFHIESVPGRGTTVELRKMLPSRLPVRDATAIGELGRRLTQERPQNPLEEVQQQNQEILRTLDELQRRQEELSRLNRELEDTNRGVVALYAELDEKADHLKRADEMKSRFLSNMSHEFRTPLNSIIALARLLLDRADGPLAEEQVRQVEFIRKAAQELSELVNDLLDLAKVEAGKVTVKPVEFDVRNLFGALRGMLRPLLLNEMVSLVFEEPDDIPALYTDEGKVSQILRNLISNALKFTERGSVRVSARLSADGGTVTFSVEDTGIGIAAEDQQRIFHEFSQLDHPIQKRVKGTGLGLPLTKRLAELLGGSVSVSSSPGIGSTFSATIPAVYRDAQRPVALADWVAHPDLIPVLVVEDSAEETLLYEKYLRGSAFQPFFVRSLREARQALAVIGPRAIVLDVMLRGEDSWTFLVELKRNAATEAIPIIVATAVEDQRKGLALGADAYGVKPITRAWLLEALTLVTGVAPARRILMVDDDPAARYIFGRMMTAAGFEVTYATGGREGVEQARTQRPDGIVLDVVMPDMSGFEVLEQLKGDERTVGIPVVMLTSKPLESGERSRLERHSAATLTKGGDTTRLLDVLSQLHSPRDTSADQ